MTNSSEPKLRWRDVSVVHLRVGKLGEKRLNGCLGRVELIIAKAVS